MCSSSTWPSIAKWRSAMTEGAKLQDPELKKLAQTMLRGQRQELAELKEYLSAHAPPEVAAIQFRSVRAGVMRREALRCAWAAADLDRQSSRSFMSDTTTKTPAELRTGDCARTVCFQTTVSDLPQFMALNAASSIPQKMRKQFIRVNRTARFAAGTPIAVAGNIRRDRAS